MESKKPKRRELNVRLPDDLVDLIKDYAWTTNRPITKIVEEALRQYLSGKKIKPRPKTEESR